MVKKVSKTKKHKVYKLLIALCSLVILIVAIAIVLHVKNENKIKTYFTVCFKFIKFLPLCRDDY